MSYRVINPKPQFINWDVIKVKNIEKIGYIKEVHLNTSQTKDEHQWTYSIGFLESGMNKVAWFHSSELKFTGYNILQEIALSSVHPFSSSAYTFNLDNKRRTKE